MELCGGGVASCALDLMWLVNRTPGLRLEFVCLVVAMAIALGVTLAVALGVAAR
jgi:hypothetical protein